MDATTCLPEQADRFQQAEEARVRRHVPPIVRQGGDLGNQCAGPGFRKDVDFSSNAVKTIVQAVSLRT